MNFRKLTKPFITLMSAGAISQLILLIISPLLTRLYTPEELGTYGVFIAVCATMAGIAGGRLELAIPVAKTIDAAAELLLLTLLVACPMSALLAALVAWLCHLFGLDSVLGERTAIWLPLAAFSIVMFQAINYWLLWNKDYSGAGRARWMQGGSVALIQLGAGYMTVGSWGLIVGHTIGQLLGAAVGGGMTTLKQMAVLASQLSLRKCVTTLREHRNYPIVMAPATLLNMLGQHLPILLIGGLYGVKAAGFYAISQRVCAAPLSLVGQAIGQIFSAEAPHLMHRSSGNMLPVFSSIIKYMLAGGALFVISLGIFAPAAVSIVFGEEWRDAGVLIQILGIVFVLEFVVTPVSLTLSFLGNHGSQLWWDMIRLLSILATFALAAKLSLNLYEAMVVLAIALACSHIYLLKLMWNSLRKHQSTSFKSDEPSTPSP